MRSKHLSFLFAAPVLLLAGKADAQFAGENDFTAPNASVHYSPDRQYDLQHVDVTISVDWPHREFTGEAIETLAPLLSGLDQVTMDAGTNLQISSVKIDGSAVPFKHDGKKLIITSGTLQRG